ncbi:Pectate lyase superfamily protein [uncultured Caudovirales phage]|uniref:Pectate lyase superfamily protein n=1 Tax=uncultured Caudovirales phage TaxID=2100421 RepID=A0A6J5N278_9CAUD|nr:Pectate lyase superfamily protein [uncultured Caudovirales phage]
MPVTLSSLAGAAAQFFDNNGVPLAGGLIYTYAAGTTTPEATYTSSTGVTPHANPIVLDAAGRIATGEIWLTSGVDYKFLVKTSANVQLGSYDNIPSVNDFTSIYAALANTTNVALGDALIGFKQSNASGVLSNAVGRTVHQKLQETISVKDFGAVGDGTTDDTSAIQAALNAGQNGAVYFPTGTYKVSSALTVNPSTHVFGSGFDAIIKTNSATANIFNISGQYVYISDIAFNSSVTRTGGYYVDILSGSSRFRIEQFWMYNSHSGICVRNTSATVTIARGEILNNVAVTGVGIKIEGGLDISIRDILIDQAAQIFAGIFITNAGDVSIEDCQLLTCGQALYLEANGTVIVSVFANNTFFDNSSRGFYALATNGGAIARCLFDQCWFSSSTLQGVLLNTLTGGAINGIDFNGCEIFLNQLNGIQIEPGAQNVQIHDCAIAGNTPYGVAIAPNVNNISVQDCNINNGYGIGANTNGILVSAGTGDYLRICNNNLSGNTTSSMIYGATGLNNVISGNLGYVDWIAYTPTIVSTVGTITTLGTVVAKYQKVNKTVTISLEIPITTNGTGAGVINVSSPFAAASAAAFAGREVNTTGAALSASIAATSSTILVSSYTGAYPGADGYRLTVSGTFNVV